MKKNTRIFLSVIIIITCLAVFLNIDTTTKQCIDYKCRTLKIPLYLKVVDLFGRHYNYENLVKDIIKDAKTDQERLMEIFVWTHNNIRKVPFGFPVVDDHVWNIIIRGYGADDQHQDVFATLCNYAKLEAFFRDIYNADKTLRKSFSFAKIKNNWVVFDVYNGIYFKNKEGQLANIKDILAGNWQYVALEGDTPIRNYQEYFNNLAFVDYENWKFTRSAIQSPFRRLIFWKNFRK